ncbi:MAG: TlyA family RNA methyltransferase [Actinomycetota bacterium]
MARPRRIDQALVASGLARSESEATELIADDRVTVNGAPVLNAARQVTERDQLAVVPLARYVSRGGLKLEAALAHFAQEHRPLAVAGARVLDAGASTGGFVDGLVELGAASVVACAVGEGLLHPRIANDPRVDVRDGVNARDIGSMLNDGSLRGEFDLVVADLSFISLRMVLAGLVAALREGGELLVLVKPQFEATKEEVDRGGGVITDETIRRRCINEIAVAVADHGATVTGEAPSAVPGPAGNREHWLRAVRNSIA